MSKKFEINIDRFDGGMSDDPRLQDNTQSDLVAHFDIFEQPKRLKPVRSLVADTDDGSTATGMKQYHVQNFAIVNGVNNIYGLGTKSDGTGYKLFKKTDITGASWTALSGAFTESTDTVWPLVFQPSVGSDQFLYFFAGDKVKALNYNAGSEYVNPSVDFTDTTTNVAEGVVAKDQYAYVGRNNSIYRLSAPATAAVVTVTIASPGVFTSTAHGLVSGSKVRFTTTGALPTGIVAGTEYFVISAGLTADNFEVSATLGGSAINTSGSQSGVHTLYKPLTATNQISIPATHEISSIDTYGNYLAFAARPRGLTVSKSTKITGTGADSSAVGDTAWANPTNITATDNTYAVATFPTVDVTVVGAGGGGGGSTASGKSGGGGGEGGNATKSFNPTDLTSSVAITVGTGGTAGPGNGTAEGGSGGSSTFGAYITATGGGGGIHFSGAGASGGIGGSATGGTTNTGGENGTAGGTGDIGAGGTSAYSGTQGAGGRGGYSAGGADTSGQSGNDGVVIIRYRTSDFGVCTGGTKTTDGDYTVHTFTSNGTFTLVSPGTGATHYLKATNFGFVIPVGATINGITVEIEKKATGTVVDSIVKIVKADGSIGSTSKALATNWPSSDEFVSYGSSSDLWSESWTHTDINDSDFGVVISATLSSGGIASVDSVRITVDYNLAPASYPNLDSFLYIWDLVSTDVTEAIKMGPGKLNIIANLGGIILGVTEEYLADAFGNDKGKIIIRAWAGGEAQILKVIPALASGGSLLRFKGIKGGRIYFYAKIPNNANASSFREGIWSFGRKDAQSPWALSLEVDTSQFASSVQGFRFVGNFLLVGHSTDGSISRSTDTETYSYTSIYQSQIYEQEFESQITSVELTTEPLPSGATATVKIRQDEETSWTTLFTMSTANSTYDLRTRLLSGEDFAKFHSCQFRIESTGGAVPVKLRARYISLSDEADE